MNKKITGMFGVAVLSVLAGWFLRGGTGGGGEGRPGGTGMMQMPPATVLVQTVFPSILQVEDETIAVVEPIEDVMIRSEVSGSIASVHFTEGGLVKEGDLLFTIDRRSYQAAADAAEADVIGAQRLYDRMKNADPRSVSRSDMETAESDLLRAQAAFRQAKVSLDYTEIKAPVSGRIGAALVTKGNYVTPASGALARIVQMDPIRITFSLTDREYLALRRKERSGSGRARIAQVRLPDGSVLSSVGRKEFDDHAVNPATGTVAVRYLFDNPDGLLLPGGYVTARLRNPDTEKGIRIPQKALLADRYGTYVLTVDDRNLVSEVRITVGSQIGRDAVVLSGLKEGDRIITDGVQKTQPGATVHAIQAEGN